MVAVLEAVRETVDVRVVDEGVVAISPGKLLGPKKQTMNTMIITQFSSLHLMRR